jgi:hypothetical protein
MMIDETSSAQQNRNLGVRIWQPVINGILENGGGRLIDSKRGREDKMRKRKRGKRKEKKRRKKKGGMRKEEKKEVRRKAEEKIK